MFRTLWCLLFLVSAVAGTTERRAVDAQALAGLLAEYRSIESLTAKFHQVKRLADLGLALESEGVFTLRGPKGAHRQVTWRVTRPSPVTVHLDEKEIRILSKDGAKERQERYALKDAGGGTLAALVTWLSLDAAGLARDHEVRAIGIGEYEFVPRDIRQSPFRAVVLKLGSKGYVEGLRLEEKSGDRIEIRFEAPLIRRKTGP